jgi:hypothetical protein
MIRLIMGGGAGLDGHVIRRATQEASDRLRHAPADSDGRLERSGIGSTA